jgi:hypothetical protein
VAIKSDYDTASIKNFCLLANLLDNCLVTSVHTVVCPDCHDTATLSSIFAEVKTRVVENLH